MWSGPIRYSPPRELGRPWMWSTFEPIPSISAPMRDEEAAEVLDVRLARCVAEDGLALGEDGGHDRVLGAHDGGLVEVDAGAAQPVGAKLVDAVDVDRRHRARRTRGCACRAGGARSRPLPGGGTVTRPKRASSGPASRNDARISRASSASRSVLPHAARGSTRTSFGPVHSTSAPRSASSSTIVSTSRMRGTFESCTSSDASTHAARIGSAPFLFPDARTVPESGRPPSMTKDCIARAMLLAVFTGSSGSSGEVARSRASGRRRPARSRAPARRTRARPRATPTMFSAFRKPCPSPS